MKDNTSFINWFMEGVYWVASKSKDPKTKIGAILVKDDTNTWILIGDLTA